MSGTVRTLIVLGCKMLAMAEMEQPRGGGLCYLVPDGYNNEAREECDDYAHLDGGVTAKRQGAVTMNDADRVQPSGASPLFADTRPEAEAVLVNLLRQAPPWRKLQMVGQMNQTVCTLALSGLRQRHPHATAEELRRRLADMLLGPELAAQAYGPLTEQE